MASVVGTDESQIRRVTCRNCASIIRFTMSETRERKTQDYTGSTDTDDVITCPKCMKDIVVEWH